MTDSTTDKIEGAFHETKGKIKEKVGEAANDPDLQEEGQTENLTGKVQKKIGEIKKVFNQ